MWELLICVNENRNDGSATHVIGKGIHRGRGQIERESGRAIGVETRRVYGNFVVPVVTLRFIKRADPRKGKLGGCQRAPCLSFRPLLKDRT